MPNWCANVLKISHTETGAMQQLVAAVNNRQLCEFAKPVPPDLQITAGFMGDGEEQRLLEQKEAANLERYGYKNWYDFCVNEWGTKWDVDVDEPVELADSITINFDSAWSPPLGVYEALLERGYTVEAYFYESGMGFAGIWDNGDLSEYAISGTAAAVEQSIPSDLDEMFCISENISMWEEEETVDE
jgi:hypothetical protein